MSLQRRRQWCGRGELHQRGVRDRLPCSAHAVPTALGHLLQEIGAHDRGCPALEKVSITCNTRRAAPLSIAYAARWTPSRGLLAAPATSRASAAPSNRQSRWAPRSSPVSTARSAPALWRASPPDRSDAVQVAIP